MVTLILAGLAVPIVVLILHDLARRPTIRRLALRNMARRKSEAALVIAGSLLGTAIVTASFIVGDTLRTSTRDGARTELGPIDEVVEVHGLQNFPSAIAAIQRGIPRTDGILSALSAPVAIRKPGAGARAEPRALLMEVDFDAARRFGGDAGASGLAGAGPTPRGNEMVIPADLARTLGARPGDQVEVFLYGTTKPFVVRAVVPKVGLAGYGRPTAFVAPGTIAPLAATSGAVGQGPPTGLVFVSNEGGVFGGAALSEEVFPIVDDRVAALSDTSARPAKKDLLDRAEDKARDFIRLFGGIGAFSVIAGVLLLVNVFTMLAEERKPELGMARALGLKRNQLVRTFGMEGAVYASLAAVGGAVLGLAVGRVVVVVADHIFNAGLDERLRTPLRFTAEPTSLLSGLVIGGVVALFTAWAASVYIGRLNVIRAIRDQPEPVLPRRRTRSLALGVAGIVAGGVMLVAGIASENWLATLFGPPVAAAGTIPLLARSLGRRAAMSWASAATILWAVVCFSVVPASFKGSGIPTFVAEGILLVGAAVGLGAINADGIGRVVAKAFGPGRNLSARLGFAYPVARRFRTSMLLGMYALIVFVLTFLAVFSKLYDAQAPQFIRDSSAGFDLVVNSNDTNPATINTLFGRPGIASVAPIVRGKPKFSSPQHPKLSSWSLSGFDKSFLLRGEPKLAARLDRFPSDKDAWNAVYDNKDLAIVSDFFLQEGTGPKEARINLGDQITAVNPTTNDKRTLTVAGILKSDLLDQGVVVGAPMARTFLGAAAVSNRHFVALKPDADPAEVSRLLTADLVQFGVDADTIAAIVRLQLQEQQGFIRLMQGYLVLGLLVGIAGLGVVMVRAVRERRRQIGMLRAMGFSRGVVRSAFLVEAGFVAVQGIVVGVLLALVVSFQLLSNSDVFGDARLDFRVPWLALGVLLVAALGASLLATAAPASQASRIPPAVALRMAE